MAAPSATKKSQMGLSRQRCRAARIVSQRPFFATEDLHISTLRQQLSTTKWFAAFVAENSLAAIAGSATPGRLHGGIHFGLSTASYFLAQNSIFRAPDRSVAVAAQNEVLCYQQRLPSHARKQVVLWVGLGIFAPESS
jgi:hypothetical protein